MNFEGLNLAIVTGKILSPYAVAVAYFWSPVETE